MPSILIAGIGNIFYGDDAFGVAVARRLAQSRLPENVRVRDFGIRGIDLVFALLDGHDLTILVDAAPGGGAPGTLYVIEPDLACLPESGDLDGHSLDPLRVLGTAAALGAAFGRILLVGCEPLSVASDDDGHVGLSAPVEAAIEPAVELVHAIIADFSHHDDAGICAKGGADDENNQSARVGNARGCGSQHAGELL